MLFGVGIDSVKIPRASKWSKGLRERFLGEDELSNASKKSSPHASYAACFAAKEAFGKALGTGLFGMPLREIQLLNHSSGAPYIVLSANLVKTLKKHFPTALIESPKISITHEGELAIAIVIIESS